MPGQIVYFAVVPAMLSLAGLVNVPVGVLSVVPGSATQVAEATGPQGNGPPGQVLRAS